jgi:hypothetical protein
MTLREKFRFAKHLMDLQPSGSGWAPGAMGRCGIDVNGSDGQTNFQTVLTADDIDVILSLLTAHP